MDIIKRKKIMMITILVLMFLSSILFFLKEFISNYVVKLDLDAVDLPGKGSRVLVVAPHSDDETLGSGEFMKKTIKNGGEVKVVLMTNGDGFKTAMEFHYVNLNPKPENYIDFGYVRQKETIEALKTFGVQEKNIMFLGYPDGGVSHIWNKNWDADNPYVSPYTKIENSPYTNSYTKHSPYAGESIVRDLSKIIMEYKPTHVIYPHPNDTHPDHWATNSFVKYSLTRMNYKPEKEWLYLVHRGDWPVPMKKETKMYLVPPAKLIDIGTNWKAVNMNESDIKEKAAAIHAYKTQIKILGPLLTAFERKNELFGEYENIKLPTSNKANTEIQPSKDNQVILDPLEDIINLSMNKGADILSIYLQQASNKDLNVFLETEGEIQKNTIYAVNLMLFKNRNVKRFNLQIKDGEVTQGDIAKGAIRNIDDVKCNVDGKMIHIVIPNKIVGEFESIFINGNTHIKDMIMDRTAYRVVTK